MLLLLLLLSFEGKDNLDDGNKKGFMALYGFYSAKAKQ